MTRTVAFTFAVFVAVTTASPGQTPLEEKKETLSRPLLLVPDEPLESSTSDEPAPPIKTPTEEKEETLSQPLLLVPDEPLETINPVEPVPPMKPPTLDKEEKLPSPRLLVPGKPLETFTLVEPVPPMKVCVPVPSTTKTTRPVYRCKAIDYCLEWPDCLCWLFHKHDGGGCVKCKGPKTKKVLMKRIVTDECPSAKCEVKEAPACVLPHPLLHHHH